MSAAQDRPANDRMLLLARASVARRLAREGLLDGLLALSYTVWPTAAMAELERQVSYGTLAGRAFGTRGNS